MASINRYNPHGVKALWDVLTGTGPFEGGSLKALLVDDTNSFDLDWDTVTNLGAYGTLGEYSGATRQTLTGVAISVIGTTVALDFDDPTYTSLSNVATMERFFLAVHKAGYTTDADAVPLMVSDMAIAPDGSDYTVTIPTNGYTVMDTA